MVDFTSEEFETFLLELRQAKLRELDAIESLLHTVRTTTIRAEWQEMKKLEKRKLDV